MTRGSYENSLSYNLFLKHDKSMLRMDILSLYNQCNLNLCFEMSFTLIHISSGCEIPGVYYMEKSSFLKMMVD